METEWVQQLPEWTPLAIGVLVMLVSVVLSVLEHFGLIDLGEPTPVSTLPGECCRFCGQTPVCEMCGRCFDPRCNAGCIWCRTPPKPETCQCCGQELDRRATGW